MKKIVLWAFIFLLLSPGMVMRLRFSMAAEGTVYIRSNGSVEGTNKIRRDGNVYTFTDDIFGSIVVEKDDIIVDGAGRSLQGAGSGIGISLTNRRGVIIRNMEIKAFDIGVYFNGSSNNIISGNNIKNNHLGIRFWIASNNTISGNNIIANERGIVLRSISYTECSKHNTVYRNNIMNNNVSIDLFGSSNAIIGNYIANNGVGIYIGGHVPLFGSQNNTIYHNTFLNNAKQVYDIHWEWEFSAISVNIWDNGYPSGGNYWSDYNGADNNRDGVGDTPYIIDENNQDNYPLISPLVALPWDLTPPKITILSPKNETYTINNVSLTFTISENASWMGYSLDGQANVTITGNATLTGLAAGSHNIIVYAEDDDGNIGASERVYFTIEVVSEPNLQVEPFPLIWIITAIAVIAIAASSSAYFIKVKKTLKKTE
jgi:parallel beta-helix repeat protein